MKYTREFIFRPSCGINREYYSFPTNNQIFSWLNDNGWEVVKFEYVGAKIINNIFYEDEYVILICEKKSKKPLLEKYFELTMDLDDNIVPYSKENNK